MPLGLTIWLQCVCLEPSPTVRIIKSFPAGGWHVSVSARLDALRQTNPGLCGHAANELQGFLLFSFFDTRFCHTWILRGLFLEYWNWLHKSPHFIFYFIIIIFYHLLPLEMVSIYNNSYSILNTDYYYAFLYVFPIISQCWHVLHER